MLEIKGAPVFDCQKCGGCCKAGQPIELYISEARSMARTTKLRLDLPLTLEGRTFLRGGIVFELLSDCGNLKVLQDGSVACKVYKTSEMPIACKVGQPGWDFCLEAIERQKTLQKIDYGP